MTSPWFIAVERFGPDQANAWANYIDWSKLTQLDELVSLDSMLCPPALKIILEDYRPHIVNENYLSDYFTNLDFLRSELASKNVENARLLCVYRSPSTVPLLPSDLQTFRFRGFDLVEAASGTSALTNCGGWPELDNSELSKCGLIEDHKRALQLQKILKKNHPEELHADCDLWAIYSEGD